MAVEENTSLITLRVRGKRVSGVQTSVQVRNLSPVLIDEPRQMGGEDAGPNPMEYVLAAFSGCLTVMITQVTHEMGFQLGDLQTTITGTLDPRGMMGTPGVRREFQQVIADVQLQTEEPKERVQQLREQVEARCPVHNLLKDAGVVLSGEWSRL